jgi:hypothetical protein
LTPIELFPLDIFDADEAHRILLLQTLTIWTVALHISLKDASHRRTQVGSGCSPARILIVAAAGPTHIAR